MSPPISRYKFFTKLSAFFFFRREEEGEGKMAVGMQNDFSISTSKTIWKASKDFFFAEEKSYFLKIFPLKKKKTVHTPIVKKCILR